MIDPPVGPDLIGDAVSEPELAPGQLVDLLRADQRRRWQSGRPLPVADYLNRFPQIHANSTCAVDLIWSEFLIRESLGDRPSLDDYVPTILGSPCSSNSSTGSTSGSSRPAPPETRCPRSRMSHSKSPTRA